MCGLKGAELTADRTGMVAGAELNRRLPGYQPGALTT
jgi:hypothetical protein